MPKVGERFAGEPAAEDRDKPPWPWKRSKRGNWWRTLPDGRNATVFERPVGSGYFSWCVADSGGPQFSRQQYMSPGAAVAALEDALACEPGGYWNIGGGD
jgi:hypothetical protein